jgi:2-acylglycerol O-acyltransferase 2
MLSLGFCSANKNTMKLRLETESIVLIPGGAAEALHAHRGILKLYLKNRKGFVRLALETNTKLIPVIGFGENDIFDTLYSYPGSAGAPSGSIKPASSSPSPVEHANLIWKLQQRFMRTMSFSLPILTSIIPKRTSLHVVVGAPVKFSSTNVDECHAVYLENLRKLYDDNKAKYGHEHVELEIM